MVTAPLTVAKLPHDVRRDFIPITRLVTLAPVLTVNPALGVKSLKELIALAKSKPGQLNYASSGMGAPNHLGMEYLLSLSGADMEHVPYKGASPGVVDLVGYQVQAGFNTLPSVLAHIKAGRLQARAVGRRQRSQLLPDVPTVGETVPGFEYVAWYGLFAPTGTPAAIVEKIRLDAARALADPQVARVLVADGSVPTPGRLGRRDLDRGGGRPCTGLVGTFSPRLHRCQPGA
jgi:tripartite-type tricarboxylate transporter receptor subunit TctC